MKSQMQVQSVLIKKQFNKYLQSNLPLIYWIRLSMTQNFKSLIQKIVWIKCSAVPSWEYEIRCALSYNISLKQKEWSKSYHRSWNQRSATTNCITKAKKQRSSIECNVKSESQRNHIEIYIKSHWVLNCHFLPKPLQELIDKKKQQRGYRRFILQVCQVNWLQ